MRIWDPGSGIFLTLDPGSGRLFCVLDVLLVTCCSVVYRSRLVTDQLASPFSFLRPIQLTKEFTCIVLSSFSVSSFVNVCHSKRRQKQISIHFSYNGGIVGMVTIAFLSVLSCSIVFCKQILYVQGRTVPVRYSSRKGSHISSVFFRF
jgi:hypothetical protein